MTRELDEQEKLIVRELIRNPRYSDNTISKNTKIPTMSVNRKRKKLEQEKLIQYYTALDRSESGIGLFYVQQLYIVKMKAGITKSEYYQKIEDRSRLRMFNSKFISTSYLGERDGHLAIIFVLHAKNRVSLNDEFNGNVVPYFQKAFGEDCIINIETVALTAQIRTHHNYIVSQNMDNAVIKKDWPNDFIFVDDVDKQNSSLSEYLSQNEK